MWVLDRLRDVRMRRRLAPATIACYRGWVRRFLIYSRRDGRWRPPGELFAPDVEAFLTHLARDRRLGAANQNQATNAIVFLYKHVLADELGPGHLGRFQAERSRRPPRVPTVLSPGEAARVIDAMRAGSVVRLMAQLLYGTGLRVAECCTLRVRDVDFERTQIVVRGGKGDMNKPAIAVISPLDRLLPALAV